MYLQLLSEQQVLKPKAGQDQAYSQLAPSGLRVVVFLTCSQIQVTPFL